MTLTALEAALRCTSPYRRTVPREVMVLAASGLRNKQISARVGTGEHTVKIHRGQVMKKMDADALTSA
jgi:DNA-binding NarL/FixJ family response regulator